MSESENTFKAYSRDDEMYCFDSIGELFDDLDAEGLLEVGRVYYEADCRKLGAKDFAGEYGVSAILEQWDNDLCEESDEASGCCNFTDVTNEAREELSHLLQAWIEKHVNVGRYWKIIGKPREMKVGPDDLKEGGAA